MRILSIFMAMCLSLVSLGSMTAAEPSAQQGAAMEQQDMGFGDFHREAVMQVPYDDFQEEAGTEDTVGPQEDITEGSAAESIGSEEEADLDYVFGRKLTEEEEEQQRELFRRYASQSRYVEPENLGGDISLSESAHIDQAWIPSAYDSRNVGGKCYITPVRDQNPYGTCWSFAAIACIEANLIKNGYADSSLDLSERHAIYFSNHAVPDKLGNSGNDVSYYAGADLYMAGGNAIQVSRSMAAWKGAVLESACPYEGIPEVPDTSPAAVYDNDFSHLKGFYRIESSDRNAVKEAIMGYGAVSASYYASEQYMNFDTGAYYCYDATGTNHAVAIVGWDDSYKKENFAASPSSNGAWLVKNSWGTRYANQGYFWLSYEDASIYDTVYAFEAEPAKRNANNYQYDTSTGGLGGGMLYRGTDFASVYTAKAGGEKIEKLTAVSVETGSEANVDYSLQIYKNPTDASDPTSGEGMLSAPQTGKLKYVGYHVIPVNKEVLLGPGDVFSVVLTLTGGEPAVLSEYDTSGAWVCDASARSGESFYSWNNGRTWSDIGATRDINLRMKAFTETTGDTFVKCTGVKISQSEAQMKEDDTLQLSAEVLPQNASDKSCVWSSDSNVVKVDQSGLVTALNAGKATIEVQTQNGGHKASCQITVKKGVEEPICEIADYIGGKEVAFKSATQGAVIYYSDKADITAADRKVENGGKVKFESFNGTLYARAYADGRWSRDTTKITLNIPKVAAPAISTSGNKVTIKTSTGGSTIYYTTDGSAPTLENGKKAGSSVTIDTFSGTVKAIAVKSGCSNSSMARKVLLNSNKGRNVSFAVKGVFGGRNVTFGSQTKGAKVYYLPTTSTLTTKDKCVNAGDTVLFEDFYGTIYARTYYNGEWGNPCRLILKIPVVNTPTVTVDNKGYATIRTTTPSSRIYYTTDGTTPSMTNGRMVSSPYVRVYVGKGKTVKAIAVRSCFTHSKVGTGK